MLLSRRTMLSLAGAGILASACDRAPHSTSSEEAASVRMKWFFAGTMAFWFDGAKSGAFSSKGIRLKIEPGGPENNAVMLVAAGRDTFGVAGAEELLLARQRNIPIVAIATLFQNSPVSFVAHQDSNIRTPSDWNGRKIEILSGNSEEVQYKALKKKFNVTTAIETPYQFNLVPFISRSVDVSIAYSMDQAVILRRRGERINEMRAMDFGVNPYGDVLITHERTLLEKPKLVARFVDATRASIVAAAANKARAVRALTAAAPQLAAGAEAIADVAAVWEATLPFIAGGDSPPLAMSARRWKDTEALLQEFGFLTQSVDLARAVHGLS